MYIEVSCHVDATYVVSSTSKRIRCPTHFVEARIAVGFFPHFFFILNDGEKRDVAFVFILSS